MEDNVRGVSPTLVCFADGSALSCRRDYDDETGFAETERFWDKVYPTSIRTFCVRDAQGTEHRALIKTKHFLTFGTEYEDTDCGRIIFDERFIEKDSK